MDKKESPMSPSYFLTNKPEGSTPLETLELLRHEKGIDTNVPMTYAGRLDPMAEGLLLILAGDECKKKPEYLGLDKEYEVEVLLGIGSDTGDVLGIVSKRNKNNYTEEVIREKIKLLIGKRSEKYPAFSSKPVNGKPLFMHAKEGTQMGGPAEATKKWIEIPEKNIEIYFIDFLGQETITTSELVNVAIQRIKKVKGDFRQEEIIESWKDLVKSGTDSHQDAFQIIKLRVKSSSGAYMRTLAEKLGESLGTKALAWKIRRTKIGEYNLQ